MSNDTADRFAAFRALFSLEGKTALVLDAASGIGRSSAEVMGALGAHVICAALDRAELERRLAALPGVQFVLGNGAGMGARVVAAPRS